MVSELDAPARIAHLRATIARKPALRRLYAETYERYAAARALAPAGLALELGSGGGFVKRFIPDMITSDVLPYDGVDRVVDATAMPFSDASLAFVCMLNVLHHIPDVEAFFSELTRCLVPGGRVLIVDQHRGLISTPLLRYLHHEGFDDAAAAWKFDSSGPLSSANGALAWIVFVRDRNRFEALFPKLALLSYQPHTPLRYFFAGGLKSWSLLPEPAFAAACRVDRWLTGLSSDLGSFVDVELVRRSD